MTADPDGLGFRGLLDAGMTPEEAWQVIHDDLAAEPGALAILMSMAQDPKGQEALDWSRRQWAAHGLPPPWTERPSDRLD
jgi:hypothetical protein